MAPLLPSWARELPAGAEREGAHSGGLHQPGIHPRRHPGDMGTFCLEVGEETPPLTP